MSQAAQGKTAVVTGASAGIGRAFATRLAADGAHVYAVDVNDCDATLEQIRTAGGSVQPARCDVSDPAQVDALARDVEHARGGCDILVNNAGIYAFHRFEELTYDIWRRYFAVNLDAMFLLARAFVPGMKRQGWGRIVNTASHSFGLMVPGLVPYIASKGGVIGLTRALASELGDCGITVNAIAPGVTRTEGVLKSFQQTDPENWEHNAEKFLAGIAASQAVKRTGRPEDLLGLLSLLVSAEASFITGQTIVVDGGWLRL